MPQIQPSRITFIQEQTDEGLSVSFGLWPGIPLATWLVPTPADPPVNGTINLTGGVQLAEQAANPGDDLTLWTDGNTLFFGELAVEVGSGGVTGSGVANQLAFWNGTASIAGDTGITVDATNNQILMTAQGRPSYSFVGDVQTGIIQLGPGVLGFQTVGSPRITVSAATGFQSTLTIVSPASTTFNASLRLPHGTAPLTPTNGDVWTTTTGLFARINSGTVGPFGTVTGSGVSTRVAFWTGTSALSNDSGMVYDSTNNQLALDFGTASLPSYAFIGDLNTGMYRVGGDDLGFSTGGSLRLDVSTSAVTSTLPILVGAGSVTEPSFSISTDTNSGLYSIGSDNLGITIGGVLLMSLAAAAVSITGSLTISGILGGFLADVIIEGTTSLLLSSAHQGRIVRFTNSGSVTVTVPDSLVVGFTCTLIQDGDGVVSVVASGGATIHNRSTQFSTAGKYALTSLVVVDNSGGSAAVAVFGGDTA